MKPTVIVIPCYNEAARLDAGAFLEFARRHDDVSLLMVNDGSVDGTHALLERLAVQSQGRIDVLNLPVNQGKGEAVRQGLLAGLADGATAVGFWDADLATPLSAIRRFQAVLADNSQMQLVMGARIPLLGHHIHRTWRRNLLGRGFATLAALALGTSVHDTQCGAKLFRASALTAALLARPFPSRWFFDVEILARLRQSLRNPDQFYDCVYELPLESWRDVAGSKLRARDLLRAGVDLTSVFYRYRLRPPARPALPEPGATRPVPLTLSSRRAA